jgi:hypothetical protein
MYYPDDFARLTWPPLAEPADRQSLPMRSGGERRHGG